MRRNARPPQPGKTRRPRIGVALDAAVVTTPTARGKRAVVRVLWSYDPDADPCAVTMTLIGTDGADHEVLVYRIDRGLVWAAMAHGMAVSIGGTILIEVGPTTADATVTIAPTRGLPHGLVVLLPPLYPLWDVARLGALGAEQVPVPDSPAGLRLADTRPTTERHTP